MTKRLLVLWGLALPWMGCTCAQLPDAYFLCEPDGTCAQPGYECRSDRTCRPRQDAGVKVDAGLDAGEVDAGALDAGAPDAGGPDAGPQDAGEPDAGPLDAGVDAGPPDAGFDAGPPCSSFPDLPDDLGLDTNCDGIDGDRAHSVFVDAVHGNDVFSGTAEFPYATLTRALAAPQGPVLVAQGTYDEALTLSGGAIYGGYNADAGWSRDAGRPVLTRPLVIADAGALVLEAMAVRVAAAVGPGASSVALTVVNSGAGVLLRNCEFSSGKGAAGADGLPGADGEPGVAGPAGVSAVDGGLGGARAIKACEPDGGPEFAWGGAGGAGASGLTDAGAGELTGGGAGADDVQCLIAPCTGIAGGDGLAGAVGAAGGAGDAGSNLGSVDGGWWFPLVGAPGARGVAGRGGAGGGGGGAVFDPTWLPMARGGGGAAGGSGGCGGEGGRGGQGGGASIAVMLFNASPTLTGCVLATAGGGRGGAGGAAGDGGVGGPGGGGGEGELVPGTDDAGTPIPDAWDGGAGGLGGPGGQGGVGGRGGGGAGGPSVGLWCSGTSTPAQPTGLTYLIGNAGTGGNPNGVAGLVSDTYGCPGL